MDIGGGFWAWSGVLRFVFMTPLLLFLLRWNGGWRPIAREIRQAPVPWLTWSTVGFGLFYAPVCWAGSYGEGWLVAGLWQVTIVAGTLLFPERGRFPWKTLLFSGLILVGVGLLQGGHAVQGLGWESAFAGLLVLVGAFSYPLGNRKIMALTQGRLTTVQRVTAMTILSLPFWTVLGVISWVVAGPPQWSQMGQTFLVAIFSGVIATILFFRATDMVRQDPVRLGAVESTQAGEVVFSLLGEIVLLGAAWPNLWSLAGLGLIILGMTVHSWHGRKKSGPKAG